IVTAGLVVAGGLALVLGRIARRRATCGKWPVRIAGFSCSAAGLLLAVSIILGFATTSVAGAASGSLAASPQANLVLIVMDTVRADHLSLDGYQRDTTPNLKTLAQDSVTYVNAFAPSD